MVVGDSFLSKYKPKLHPTLTITTHNCMNGKNNKNGGTFIVPFNKSDQFIKECFDAYKAKVSLYLTERVPKGGKFRFFMDIDFDALDNENIPEPEHLIPYLLSVVRRTTSDKQKDIVISMRGPFKIHITCPGVIVDYNSAMALYNHIFDKVSCEYPDLTSKKSVGGSSPWKKVLDSSVYKSGLRMLVSRKVKDSEPNYYSVYEYDGSDLKQLETTLELVSRSSIHVDQSCELTKFTQSVKSTGGSGSSVAKKNAPGDSSSNSVQSEGGSDPKILAMFFEHFRDVYNLRVPLKSFKVDHEHKTIIVPLTELWCNIARREHKSNHPYILINATLFKMKCHDEECSDKEYKPVIMSEKESAIQDFYLETFCGKPISTVIDTLVTQRAETDIRENMLDYYPYPENKDMVIKTVDDMIKTNLSQRTCLQ